MLYWLLPPLASVTPLLGGLNVARYITFRTAAASLTVFMVMAESPAVLDPVPAGEGPDGGSSSAGPLRAGLPVRQTRPKRSLPHQTCVSGRRGAKLEGARECGLR